MANIKNIPSGCAVFNPQTNLYHVNLPYNHGSSYYQEEKTLNAGLNILPSLDDIYKIQSNTIVVGYELFRNGVSLEKLSIEEYNNRLSWEEPGSMAWLRLKYNKKEITALQENKIQCIVTNLGKYETPNSKYITCKLDSYYGKGIYELDCRQLELDILESVKQKYPSLLVEIPTHGYLRYMKINKQYVLNDNWADRRLLKFRGSLEQCMEKELKISLEATTDFNGAFSKIITLLSELTLHDFKEKLDIIINIAKGIKVRDTIEANNQKNTLIGQVTSLNLLVDSIIGIQKNI